ncbi:hypothetical protein [Bdellovibrio sp. HCB274]|uniref:hypothetical protein n=1 Tax=Bdellovibrio sp. HCB274 TaxID=3394361 RepID=UPI0039B64377
MPQTQSKSESKKAPAKLSRYRREKIKKAQEQGALSDVAFSHTSKQKIMKAVKKNDKAESK